MIQEIIALTIVFLAVVYTAFNSYKFFFGAAKSGCGSGCGSCGIKSELAAKIKAGDMKKRQYTFNPKDLQLN